MAGFTENLKEQWRKSGVLLQLILINLALFIPLNISANFGGNMLSYVAMPSDWHFLLAKPWTLIANLFSHEMFGHIFYNMIWLWIMGRIFIFVTGFTHWSKITFIYLAGGLLGCILFFLLGNILPSVFGGYLHGASGGVMAIALAVGFFSPNYEINMMFIGPVKVKWVVIFLFATTTLIDLSMNVGGKVAHLGGAVFGMLYGIQLKSGKDMSAWFTKIFSRKRTSLKVVHSKRSVSDYEYNEKRHEREKTLDELLDKINKSGYESLSKKEKETLHILSKK